MENVVIPEFTTIWSMLLWMAVTVLMPLAVGLITRPSTPAGVKSLLLVIASALNGFLSEALEAGSKYRWEDGWVQFLSSLVIAIALHYGVWKPLGASRRAQEVGAGPVEKRVV